MARKYKDKREFVYCPNCQLTISVFVDKSGDFTIPVHGHKRECSHIGKMMNWSYFVKRTPEPQPEPTDTDTHTRDVLRIDQAALALGLLASMKRR